jgi:transcription initiation factor TFIIIB Brf1 subunit/transcription initiation factor TFIIB
MTIQEMKCSECGGNVHLEGVFDKREYVCKDCGSVVDSEELVIESETADEEERDYEVEEL